MAKIKRMDPITTAEARTLLEREEENLNTFQEDVLRYLRKFSKLGEEKAKELVERLEKDFNIDKYVAVQIVNIMPEDVNTLKVLLPTGLLISEDTLKKIVDVISEYREK
ncbi:hypothetical protein DRO02_01620 [archaeon]|nr:MAG: hypothetical protein DRO02_01620 [archaeon]RLG65700.1 MAG: hypothetical protein DRO21_01365 [archaeon]HDM23555.1 hypothetical protein [Candidatus Bathyarchaeota archaeon]